MGLPVEGSPKIRARRPPDNPGPRRGGAGARRIGACIEIKSAAVHSGSGAAARQGSPRRRGAAPGGPRPPRCRRQLAARTGAGPCVCGHNLNGGRGKPRSPECRGSPAALETAPRDGRGPPRRARPARGGRIGPECGVSGPNVACIEGSRSHTVLERRGSPAAGWPGRRRRAPRRSRRRGPMAGCGTPRYAAGHGGTHRTRCAPRRRARAPRIARRSLPRPAVARTQHHRLPDRDRVADCPRRQLRRRPPAAATSPPEPGDRRPLTPGGPAAATSTTTTTALQAGRWRPWRQRRQRRPISRVARYRPPRLRARTALHEPRFSGDRPESGTFGGFGRSGRLGRELAGPRRGACGGSGGRSGRRWPGRIGRYKENKSTTVITRSPASAP